MRGERVPELSDDGFWYLTRLEGDGTRESPFVPFGLKGKNYSMWRIGFSAIVRTSKPVVGLMTIDIFPGRLLDIMGRENRPHSRLRN
jgi:hypothetical protein